MDISNINISNLLEMMGMGYVTTAYILWVTLFSLIGLVFFLYGKKQKKTPYLFIGIALMIYPMFVTNTYVLVVIGVILAIIPYFIK